MLYIKLNKQVYELPMGDLYRDELGSRVSKDTITIDGLSDVNTYKVLSKIFDNVANVIHNSDLNSELESLIVGTKNLQKRYASEGRYFQSNEELKKALLVMLEYYQKVHTPDTSKHL